MFQLSVSDLLASYPGDSRELAFQGEIIPEYYPGLTFISPLDFTVKLVALDDGVEVIFETLQAEVMYEWVTHMVSLSHVSRTFKEIFDPIAPDDIKFIEKWNIDLKEILYEEILMAIL